MPKLDVERLMDLSRPAMARFARVEPKRWDRRAILLELVGEVGALAHHVQRWDGFKHGRADMVKIADECSDVLFMLLRLAEADAVALPRYVEVAQSDGGRAGDIVLDLEGCVTRLREPAGDGRATLVTAVERLAALADLVGIDLVKEHEREMAIAMLYFDAAGDAWPRIRVPRNLKAVLKLWLLMREKKRWPRR
jgi:NTP pyrophosphatase (non-canonical NTP hydrolase)